MMRILTVERRKSFAGCFGAVRIYVEDPANELDILGVPCRRLGELRNGKSGAFEIPEHACRIFAIVDKASRNYCVSCLELPDGSEPVTAGGQNVPEISNGNPFLFDGESEFGKQNRKNTGKSVLRVVLLIFVAALFAFIGRTCTAYLMDAPAKEKTFESAGLSIVLTDDFSETDMDGFDACYASSEALVAAVKEPFTLLEGCEDWTLSEYGETCIEVNGTDSTLNETDGVTWFDYSLTIDGTGYYYLTVVEKGSDAFWAVSFAGLDSRKDTLRTVFLGYAATITVE